MDSDWDPQGNIYGSGTLGNLKILLVLPYKDHIDIPYNYKWCCLKVRGVLGNKCAGQHNSKTVHFRETLASGNFLAWSSAICVFFFSALSTLGRRRPAASFYVMMVGVTPYKPFLKVSWVNRQLASSDFLFIRS